MVGVSEFVFPDHDIFFSSLPPPCKRVCRGAPSVGSSLSSGGGSYDLATGVVDGGGGIEVGTESIPDGDTGTAVLVDEVDDGHDWVMGPAGPADTRPKPGGTDTTAPSPTIGPGVPAENESDTVAASPGIGGGTAEELCIYNSTVNGSLNVNTPCYIALGLQQNQNIHIMELFPKGSIIDYKEGPDHVTVVKMPGQPVARRFTRNGIWKLLIVKEMRPTQLAVDFTPSGIEVTYPDMTSQFYSNKELDKLMRYYHWWVSDNFFEVSTGTKKTKTEVVLGLHGFLYARWANMKGIGGKLGIVTTLTNIILHVVNWGPNADGLPGQDGRHVARFYNMNGVEISGAEAHALYKENEVVYMVDKDGNPPTIWNYRQDDETYPIKYWGKWYKDTPKEIKDMPVSPPNFPQMWINV